MSEEKIELVVNDHKINNPIAKWIIISSIGILVIAVAIALIASIVVVIPGILGLILMVLLVLTVSSILLVIFHFLLRLLGLEGLIKFESKEGKVTIESNFEDCFHRKK